MSKDKRMILGNAFSAFERLDLSKVQSINLEMVEYDDVTNGFLDSALNATAEEQ